MALRGDVLGTRVLVVSSLGRLGQRKLLEREADLHADILITSIPTRGEPVANVLLEAVKPRLLIIGCSEYPVATRPGPPLRKRLDATGIPVLYTSDVGAVTVTLPPRTWTATTMQESFGARRSESESERRAADPTSRRPFLLEEPFAQDHAGQ